MQDNKKVGIIIAIIIGCYFLGLIEQVLVIPITNAMFVEDIKLSFDIITAYSFVFTKGLAVTAGIIILGVYIYKKRKEMGKTTDSRKDERGFTISNTGIYGTARWMNSTELLGLFNATTTTENVTGTILGTKNGKIISTKKLPRFNEHKAIYGATGSGKSSSFAIPMIYGVIKRGESIIMTDPKSELYNETSRYFRENGYEVKVFNLVECWHSDSWNCLNEIGDDPLMAQTFADIIIKNTSDGKKGDPFWENSEMNLLKALSLYVQMHPSIPPNEKNMGTVYDLALTGDTNLASLFNQLSEDHPAKFPYRIFAQAEPKVRTSVVAGFGTRLQVFQNKLIKEITSYNEIDLIAPAKKKCAYFVITSDQESTLDFLASLFFSFLFIKLVKYADSTKNRVCDIPVNFLLDEFPNIGEIPDFTKKLSTIRSRRMSATIIFQSVAHLKGRYPNDEWQNIISNCDMQICLGCNDPQTAEFLSKRSGELTAEVTSTSTNKKTMAPVQLIPEYKETEGKGKRMLLTPHEVQTLPPENLLVVFRGQKVLKLKKYFYKEHPEYKKLKPTLSIRHVPNWVKSNSDYLKAMKTSDSKHTAIKVREPSTTQETQPENQLTELLTPNETINRETGEITETEEIVLEQFEEETGYDISFEDTDFGLLEDKECQ